MNVINMENMILYGWDVATLILCWLSLGERNDDLSKHSISVQDRFTV